MTAIILATLFLATTMLALLWGQTHKDRARNLDELRAELEAQLDDALRENEQLRTSNMHHVRETSTLAMDLAYAETQASYYRSVHMRRKADALGVLFASGLVRAERHMLSLGEVIP